LNWYVYCGNNPIKFIDPSGNSYEYVNKGKVTRGKYDYHEIEITIDAKSLLSTHTFYIRDKEDVIRFYNDEENTDLAFRSKDLAEGMFAAFKDIKGYELSGRTIGGIHSELVLHDALYRKGYKLESTTEADMGTPRFKYFSGRIPFLPTGNDYDAWRFEVLQSDSDMAIAKWGINSIFEAQRKMKESLSQMQQFKNDLGYFLSNDYFKYKLLDNLNKYHR
jgi:hypothetical protein